MMAPDEPEPAADRDGKGDGGPTPPPLLCTNKSQLFRVRVWTDAEWRALDPSERPALHKYVPGVGWVAAVPVESLN